MIGAGAASGCAVLTKGPVALIFFGAAVLAGIYVYGAGRIKGRSGHILAGLSSFVIIAAPWPLLTLLQQPEFLSVLEEEVVAKRVGELSLKAPVKALTSPLALVFPWSFLVIAALVRPFLPGVKESWRALPGLVLRCQLPAVRFHCVFRSLHDPHYSRSIGAVGGVV